MPKKSKKSLSKRVKLKDKFKVIRKVKEHNRKQRKETKKQEKKKASVLRDPGIPKNFPYRDQVIKELQFEHQRIVAQCAARKEAARQKRHSKVEGQDEEMPDNSEHELVTMREGAASDQAEFIAAQAENYDYLNDGSAGPTSAFFQQFKKVVESSDVILHVLDVRDPLSCRCPAIERHIRQVDPNKRIILVLNKVDLVPGPIVRKWLSYLREELPTVAFKAASKKSSKSSAGDDQGIDTNHCLGTDALLKLLKSYTRNNGLNTSIAVGVVGLPNVGKSSVINSLKRAKVANVGNAPGVTRSVQEIHLDKHVRLLDSPGLVLAALSNRAAAALYSGVKIEQLDDPASVVESIMTCVPERVLMEKYKIGIFSGYQDLLRHVANVRGRLKKGGTADTEGAAQIILADWRDGTIPFSTLPPSRGNETHEASEVLLDFSEEFDMQELFDSEAQPSLEKPAAKVAFHVPEHEQSAPPMQQDADVMDVEVAPMEDASGKVAQKSQHVQNSLLYAAHGQSNPSTRKADKKKAKRARSGKIDAAV